MNINLITKAAGALVGVLVAAGAVASYQATSSFQRGNPGVGMEVVYSREGLAETVALNKAPLALPPASEAGQLSVDAYKNVRVLGHITSGEMTRLMTAMTLWVAPKEGCAYCHAPLKNAAGEPILDQTGLAQADPNKLDSDELYTKVVSRRMLEMTMHINADWQDHVKATGVTCYTCHRGNPVPTQIWFDDVPPSTELAAMGSKAGQNAPTTVANLSSLPGSSSLRAFLVEGDDIRVQSLAAIDSGNRKSIKQTEWTYSLMTHMSEALGVNCTFCHNSRSWGDWSQSPLTRTTAWHGVRLVRDVNNAFLEPLRPTFPANRLGPLGDVPKANCATCHHGAYKPLLGVSMLKDYQVLAEPKPQPAKSVSGAMPTAPPAEPPPAPEGSAAAPVESAAAPEGSAAPGASAGAPSATASPSASSAP